MQTLELRNDATTSEATSPEPLQSGPAFPKVAMPPQMQAQLQMQLRMQLQLQMQMMNPQNHDRLFPAQEAFGAHDVARCGPLPGGGSGGASLLYFIPKLLPSAGGTGADGRGGATKWKAARDSEGGRGQERERQRAESARER